MKRLFTLIITSVLSVTLLTGCASLAAFESDTVTLIEKDLPGWQSALNGAWTVVDTALTSEAFLAVLESFGASPSTAQAVENQIGVVNGYVKATNADLNEVESLVATVVKSS